MFMKSAGNDVFHDEINAAITIIIIVILINGSVVSRGFKRDMVNLLQLNIPRNNEISTKK